MRRNGEAAVPVSEKEQKKREGGRYASRFIKNPFSCMNDGIKVQIFFLPIYQSIYSSINPSIHPSTPPHGPWLFQALPGLPQLPTSRTPVRNVNIIPTLSECPTGIVARKIQNITWRRRRVQTTLCGGREKSQCLSLRRTRKEGRPADTPPS